MVLASIDGGPQSQLELYVTKKNGCLFDLEHIAPPGNFERGRADLAGVVAAFEFPIQSPSKG